MKLLASADIHIGRRPSSLPQELDSFPSIWEKLVDYAIEQEVDAVLLAGDIVDAQNKFFESIGILEKGLHQLGSKGIHTYAIAGNHDYDVLKNVWKTLNFPHFHLLGKNKEWDSIVIRSQTDCSLRIIGYSFSDSTMTASPMGSFPNESFNDSIPTIGLLHGDLDQPNSRYGPITTQELSTTGVPLWILGHIHKPQQLKTWNGTDILYTGSPQGLDPGPGECGAHGPWIIEWNGHNFSFEQIILSYARYENCSIDITGLKTREELENRIHKELYEQADRYSKEHLHLQCLSLCLTLAGRTALSSIAISKMVQPLVEEGVLCRTIKVQINKLSLRILPEIDLKRLSEGEHIQAQLARLILDLKQEIPSKETDSFLETLSKEVKQIRDSVAFHHPATQEPDEQTLKEMASQQAVKLLEHLLASGINHE